MNRGAGCKLPRWKTGDDPIPGTPRGLVPYPPFRRSRFSFSFVLSRVFQRVRPLLTPLKVVNPSKLAQPSHPCLFSRFPAASSEMGITKQEPWGASCRRASGGKSPTGATQRQGDVGFSLRVPSY